MPLRKDIKSVLIIGAGPIVIVNVSLITPALRPVKRSKRRACGLSRSIRSGYHQIDPDSLMSISSQSTGKRSKK